MGGKKVRALNQNGVNTSIQVLIIEDDLRIAEINKRFVQKVPGYEVVGVTTNGAEAKELLAILQPDLVLLDIYFPDISGLDLLKYIRINHSNTDVIMITAAKEVESVRSAIRSGVFDFIIKPIIFERFQETLFQYQKFHATLDRLQKGQEEIGQEEIDDLLRTGANKPSFDLRDEQLPKGIDRLTMDKVTAVIHKAVAGITAEAIGKEIGASRTTARRYLEYLVAKGNVVADLVYGTVGRPERIYRIKKDKPII